MRRLRAGDAPDPSLIPLLQRAVRESIAYGDELRRRHGSEVERGPLAEEYGLGVYDLRETLQEAITMVEKR